MSQIPIISVLMPVYNGGPYLQQAISSVLNQTFDDFEFLILDDGSTDDSLEIIKSFRDPRIRVISEKHLGLIKILNQGLQKIRGKYLARMDADDLSMNNRLEKQFNFLEENPEIGSVSCAYRNISMTGVSIQDVYLPISHQQIVQRFSYGSHFMCHAASMMRSSIVQEIFYRNEFPHAEDLDFWIRLSEKMKLANLDEILYWVRQHPQSVSQQHRGIQERSAYLANSLWEQRKKGEAENFQQAEKEWEEHKNKISRRECQERELRDIMHQAMSCAFGGQRLQAFNLCWHYLKRRPWRLNSYLNFVRLLYGRPLRKNVIRYSNKAVL